MAESPRSEKSQTRFSTPVSNLDDHRLQPESLPRVDDVRPGTRRGTLASIVGERPDLLQVNNTLEHHGSVARDFEQAIVDDDRSVRSGDETMFARRGSASPAVARKNTFRRAHHPHGEKIGRSRASSHSSRSESPPNSVDAFAEPRRRGRAGTVTSLAPSHVELTLQRTHSGGTHRRRPTFSEHNPNDAANDASSRHSSAEDDVCFPPPEESSKTYTIDFEELEEFVVETHKKTPVAHPLLRRYSISSQSKAKKLK
ncbi:hypothetical protein B0A49_00770, partial [Cryomyces minteri]